VGLDSNNVSVLVRLRRHVKRDVPSKEGLLVFSGRKKMEVEVALDFGEKGSDDVFWALEIRLGQRP
jgi:hypothetical protein